MSKKISKFIIYYWSFIIYFQYPFYASLKWKNSKPWKQDEGACSPREAGEGDYDVDDDHDNDDDSGPGDAGGPHEHRRHLAPAEEIHSQNSQGLWFWKTRYLDTLKQFPGNHYAISLEIQSYLSTDNQLMSEFNHI